MYPTNQIIKPIVSQPPPTPPTEVVTKYKCVLNSAGINAYAPIESVSEQSTNINDMLNREKQKMNSEPWNKLNKTMRIQKLHAFAESYGKEHNFNTKEIKQLKTFFSECLQRDKLIKVKEVQYNKDTGSIINIPNLSFNTSTKNFTLRTQPNPESVSHKTAKLRETESA